MTQGRCPVCGTQAQLLGPVADFADTDAIECPRCGRFLISGTVRVVLENLVQRRAINSSRLSHVLRLRYDARRQPPPFLRQVSDIQPYQDDPTHTSPQEQIDNLILWIGKNQGAPHEWIESTAWPLAARIGAAISPDDNSEPGLTWILRSYEGSGLFSFRSNSNGTAVQYQLKLNGWARFAELSRRIVNSRNAFMAMKFGDATLDKVLKDCFQPAAARAGFTLRPLNEQPVAGLIDNQVRAAIRTARFVIADLSHDNNGAYFEAGFTEGLGLPVIYTCEAGKFSREKTHFDTNHMVTVLWDAARLDEAGRALTATIRNTLPFDSKLDD